MATQELIAGMALVDLPVNAVMKFEAVHPTTGAAVANVTLSSISITADVSENAPLETVAVVPPLFSYGPNE